MSSRFTIHILRRWVIPLSGTLTRDHNRIERLRLTLWEHEHILKALVISRLLDLWHWIRLSPYHSVIKVQPTFIDKKESLTERGTGFTSFLSLVVNIPHDNSAGLQYPCKFLRYLLEFLVVPLLSRPLVLPECVVWRAGNNEVSASVR